MKRTAKTFGILALSAVLMAGCSTAETADTDQTDGTVTAEAVSTLYGSAYTNGKSTLKKEYGIDVEYGEDSKAVITLTAENGTIDDSKIDSSKAVVTLEDGDAYDPDDFVFSGDGLDGKWKNGTYVYRLKTGDIEPSNFGYEVDNGGNEWSALGSDGKGLYYFNLKVSGIEYDGQEIDPLMMRANVQIYGYDYTADAADMYTELPKVENTFEPLADAPQVSEEPVFTWVGEGEKPILCDALADSIYITWPQSYKAENLADKDVKITLTGEFGDELVLEPSTDYSVVYEEGSTQIGINYQYWAFAPVYTDMNVTVDHNAVEGMAEDLSESYEIASVYVNPIQYGGGMDSEGTVIVQQLNGFSDETTIEEAGDIFYYILTTVVDGKDVYLAEDENGNVSLTPVRPTAKFFMSDADHVNAQQIGNKLFFTEHNSETEDAEVDGVTYTFNRLYGVVSVGDTSSRSLMPGYVWSENIQEHHKWAWQSGLKEGWTAINITPMEGRYTWAVEKGSEEAFSSDSEKAVWSVLGAASADTSVDENGTLKIGSDESASSFALIATDQAGHYGALTIYPR